MTEENQKIEESIQKEFIEIVYRIRKERKIHLVGECKKCGQCREGSMRIFRISDDTIKFERFDVSRECGSFDKEKRICKDHDDDVPVCRLYPYLPENILPGCGFRFEEDKEVG